MSNYTLYETATRLVSKPVLEKALASLRAENPAIRVQVSNDGFYLWDQKHGGSVNLRLKEGVYSPFVMDGSQRGKELTDRICVHYVNHGLVSVLQKSRYAVTPIQAKVVSNIAGSARRF